MSEKAAWKNRVVKMGLERACDILANPFNAKFHPTDQRVALRTSLTGIGITDAITISLHTGVLLDGHARVEEALSTDETMLLPAMWLDLNEKEEAIYLATHDWLTALAVYESSATATLLDMAKSENESMNALLETMRESLETEDIYSKPVKSKKKKPVICTCPKCFHVFEKDNPNDSDAKRVESEQ